MSRKYKYHHVSGVFFASFSNSTNNLLTNQPIELWSNAVIEQKVNYIHQNPVISGFVTDSIDWKNSGAINYNNDQTVFRN